MSEEQASMIKMQLERTKDFLTNGEIDKVAMALDITILYIEHILTGETE